jgi:GAF domain-containing protein
MTPSNEPIHHPEPDTADLILEQLRSTLERARVLADHLEARVGRLAEYDDAARKIGELERRLADYQRDMKELSFRLVDSEKETNRLLGLYAGLYQLHASLDPAVVVSAVHDVVTNLLGADRFALLLFEGRQRTGPVRVAMISDEADMAEFCTDDEYRGGDPLIDAALKEGRFRLVPTKSSRALAVIPLAVDDQPVGALVIFKLFEHRPPLGVDDEALLELLAVHAASAVYSARMHDGLMK